MFKLFSVYRLLYPEEKLIWIKIRILHETDKAILVFCNNTKIWIAKSRIRGIRLKNGVFEIYVKESVVV